MDRVHETYLRDVLRDVYQFGAARVRWPLIYRWFNAERITRRVWSDIHDMWTRLLDELDDAGWQLGYIDVDRNDEVCFVLLPAEGASLDDHFVPLSKKLGGKE